MGETERSVQAGAGPVFDRAAAGPVFDRAAAGPVADGAGANRSGHTVALVTLGCARNDVDSEELAGRLAQGGFTLVEDPEAAETVVVNTCGFIEQAKRESIDTVLSLSELKGTGTTAHVVAVGCMAERYGAELADALPEADAVLGFDDYADIGDRLRSIIAGAAPAPHVPRDRRTLLPLAPAERAAARPAAPHVHAAGTDRTPAHLATPVRRRLRSGPVAPVKIASGCDRRCAFCAIPAFRGAFVSRPADEILSDVTWLAANGVREAFLVSENSTSYGKDLGDLQALERLLPRLTQVPGLDRVRVSYLQPAEIRPGLIDAIAGTPGVAPYFDISFQHASASLLRRMRRFGSTDAFLDLLARIRAVAPNAGIRTNVILGFPGETDDDVAELIDFLEAARLDAVGVFGYSDEDGTEGATLDGKVDADEIAVRVDAVASLVDDLMHQRAAERIGDTVQVLVTEVDADGPVGIAGHQGPDGDGTTRLLDSTAVVGQLVRAVVEANDGPDLVARPVDLTFRPTGR